MRISHFFSIAIFSALLTACTSKPASYLPTGTQPIVNVEADLAQFIHVEAKSQHFKVANQTDQPLNVVYKLFWYDIDGVSQTLNPTEKGGWHNFWLEPQAKTEWQLSPPTPESVNYRIYLRRPR